MERILRILEDVRPDVDFENEKSLVDGNILDSFDIISIIEEIKDELGIEIDVSDIIPENFNSAESIFSIV